MREILKLFIIVTLFSAIAGLALATVRDLTAEQIEIQENKYVRGPALDKIFEGCTNKPLEDRFKVMNGEEELNVFVGEIDGKKNTVAFENYGTGFGGKIGVMVAFDLDKDEIFGVSVTTHSETPGLGSRAKTEPAFAGQFKGMSLDGVYKVKADGGDIDALSGATVTSRGVSGAVEGSIEMYKKLKDEIIKKL